MKTVRKTLITAAIIGLLGASALQASAQGVTKVTANGVYTRTEIPVNYADLDLDSAAGQKALYARISQAAKQACGPSNSLLAGSRKIASRNRGCYQASLSRALSKVNQSAVAAVN